MESGQDSFIFPEDWERVAIRCSSQLFGPAGDRARHLVAKAQRMRARSISSMMLFMGEPGTGKSSLCEMLAAQLVDNPQMIDRRSGGSVSKEDMQAITRTLTLRSILSEYQVVIIDEIDKMARPRLEQLIQVHDRLVPDRTLLATTNKEFDQVEERIRTRFQVWDIEGPDATDITEFIMEHWWHLGVERARGLAEECRGNVRYALKLAQQWYDAHPGEELKPKLEVVS